MSSSSSRGFLIALIATVLWSTTGPLISYLSKTYALPSLVLAFWRDLFVSVGMVAGLLIFSRKRLALERRHWAFMTLYGLTVAVFNAAWTFSVQYNGAAVATVLAFSSPALTALLSYLIFKERFSRVKIISIALSFAGTILVSGAHDPAIGQLNPAGILFGLLTGLMFAFYNLEGKAATVPHPHPSTLGHALAWRFPDRMGHPVFPRRRTHAGRVWVVHPQSAFPFPHRCQPDRDARTRPRRDLGLHVPERISDRGAMGRQCTGAVGRGFIAGRERKKLNIQERV